MKSIDDLMKRMDELCEKASYEELSEEKDLELKKEMSNFGEQVKQNEYLKKEILKAKKYEIERKITEHKTHIKKHKNNILKNRNEIKNIEHWIKNHLTEINKLKESKKNLVEVVKGLNNLEIGFLLCQEYRNAIKYPQYLINEKENRLVKEYPCIASEEQYQKWKLLKINDFREICQRSVMPGSRPFYLYDKKIKKYIKLFNITLETIEMFLSLKDLQVIKELSLKPNPYSSLQEDLREQEQIEEKEFGKYFSFENLKDIIPTKLFSKENINDTLWINIDKKNITFEEILDDFQVIEEDVIVTQVIHCEYFENNNNFFISHLDHEYIFYSLEEFEKRKIDINQKGNAYKRVKTFKIDQSKIPFILENGQNILLFFLNQYFECHNLLLEYFQEMEKI